MSRSLVPSFDKRFEQDVLGLYYAVAFAQLWSEERADAGFEQNAT